MKIYEKVFKNLLTIRNVSDILYTVKRNNTKLISGRLRDVRVTEVNLLERLGLTIQN